MSKFLGDQETKKVIAIQGDITPWLNQEIATLSRLAGLLAMTTGVIANEGEAIPRVNPGDCRARLWRARNDEIGLVVTNQLSPKAKQWQACLSDQKSGVSGQLIPDPCSLITNPWSC